MFEIILMVKVTEHITGDRPASTNFSLAFLLYTWRIYGLLLIQVASIPPSFTLFPAGFFLQFLGLADLLLRQFGRFTGDLPLLCEWANLAHPACTPALWSFHLGHALLALVALRYGRILFDKSSDRYALSLERLAKRLKR